MWTKNVPGSDGMWWCSVLLNNGVWSYPFLIKVSEGCQYFNTMPREGFLEDSNHQFQGPIEIPTKPGKE